MRTRLLGSLVASLLFLTAFAAGLPTFEILDVDGNGSLSPEELEVMEQFSGEDSDFPDADKDDDGALSAAEYAAWTEIEVESTRSTVK